MKKLSLSPRFTKLMAAILSAVVLITACGINLLCFAAEPEMYIAFSGENADAFSIFNGASASHTIVDNVSPDGKALSYTVTKSEAQFNVHLNFDSGTAFSSLTPAKLKAMNCFFYWISAPQGSRLGNPVLKDAEGTNLKANFVTYNTVTGEVEEWTDGFDQSGFEGYVIVDLSSATFDTQWNGKYERTWSDMVSATSPRKNGFKSIQIWHGPESEGSTIVIDSIGIAPDIEAFLDYQKSRPLKTNAPQASSPAGRVATGTQIKLTSLTAGAEIYYTTDGTDPTTSDTRIKYELDNNENSPIVVNDILTLRAVAVNRGRYSTVSVWSYNTLGDDTPNTTVVNDGSDLGLTWHFDTHSSLTVVEGMGPKGKAYKSVGLMNSGAHIISFNFNDKLQDISNMLGIQETFSYWVSNSDSSAQDFSLSFNKENVYYYGDVVTFDTVTGQIKEYNNVSGIDIAEFEGYVIFKLQNATFTEKDENGSKIFSWQEFVNKNGISSFVTYRDNLKLYGKSIIWDEFAFSISYDKLIEELKAAPLRTSPPVADQPNGSLPSGTQIYLTSSTEGAEIYYTLDGSDPIENGTLYVPIFMAEGLYDSPIRIAKSWTDKNVAPDENGIYTLKAVAVADDEEGNPIYSAVQTFEFSVEPEYDGPMDVVLNNGDGTGSNCITWSNAAYFDPESGAEYTRGDTGEPDLGNKFTVVDANKAHIIFMGLDTSKCEDSTGYNHFHNIQALTYRIEVSGLADNAVYKNALILKDGCNINATTYLISDDGSVKKNAEGSISNGTYTVVVVIDDSTTVSGWAVDTQSFRQYCKNNTISAIGYYISPQELEKGYEHPVIIYDDYTAHFDKDALFEKLGIDGLLADYDSGTYENNSMLVCNDGSGAKLNGGLTAISEGLSVAVSNRSKDELCLALTSDTNSASVSLGSFTTDFDAILCDGTAFWVEIPKGTGSVTLDFKLSDIEEGTSEHFKYADTKWHYQIDEDGAVSRVYGKIVLVDGFRGWVIIPGDNFHFIDGDNTFVNGTIDFDKLSEFTVAFSGNSLAGKTVYLDDISIYSSLEDIVKSHAKTWKTTIN